MMKKIIVTCATREEFVQIDWPSAEIGHLLTGLGKTKSAYYLAEAIRAQHPDLVMNIGTAGTLHHKVGDIFVCRHFVDRDMEKLKDYGVSYEIELPEDALDFIPSCLYTNKGVCNTGDTFLTEHEDVTGDVIDMIPNLNIDFTSGEPGQAAKINIRGEASINGGSPLILIDGVASDSEEMNRLLPQDIESISVLKDAASAAIYGARAAFGVILITTKRGAGDRIRIEYNNNFSWKRPSMMTNETSDPYIYLKLKNIAVLNTPWSSGHEDVC